MEARSQKYHGVPPNGIFEDGRRNRFPGYNSPGTKCQCSQKPPNLGTPAPRFLKDRFHLFFLNPGDESSCPRKQEPGKTISGSDVRDVLSINIEDISQHDANAEPVWEIRVGRNKYCMQVDRDRARSVRRTVCSCQIETSAA